MRIDCPTCQAAYDVPDTVIAAGRTLRCARCGKDFMPQGAPPPAADALPPPPEPPASAPLVEAVAERPFVAPGDIERLVQTAQRGPAAGTPALAVAAAWLLSIALLGAAGWAAVMYRGPIAHAWPPASRVYAALGY